jgi:hypothetical protein
MHRSAAFVLGLILFSGLSHAQLSPGGLFPRPFVVEHQVIITDSDGSTFAGEPVADHYGGSMIVSVRPDGSRLIVDFARRELTEIRPASGTFAVITFDRMAQLTLDLQLFEGPTGDLKRGGRVPDASFVVTEVASNTAAALATPKAIELATAARGGAAELRRLDVAEIDEAGDLQPVVELWLDSSIRLSAPALDAMENFELQVLGAAAGEAQLVPLKAVATARRHSGGALPVATARAQGIGAGRFEDVALRVESLDALPIELVTIPEGFDRTPHPLELMVAHADRERELRRLMGSTARPGGDR